ncbi:MAG: beta strand repeat-containing protein [Burkholderiales bacterium]
MILPKIPPFYKPTPDPGPNDAKEEGQKETAAAAPAKNTGGAPAEQAAEAPAEIRDTSVVDPTSSVTAATATTATVVTAPPVVAPVIPIELTDPTTGTTLNVTTQTATSRSGTTVPVTRSVSTTNPVVATSDYDFGVMAVKPVSGGVERSDFPTVSPASANTNFVLSDLSLVEILNAPYERFGMNYQAQTPIAGADIKFSGGVAADAASDPNGTYYMGRWIGGKIDVKDLATSSPVAPFTDLLGPASAHWIIGLAPGNSVGSPSINAVQQLLGSASYSLAAATHPTDAFGNVGTLNSATLAANFSAQTVNAGLNLSFSSTDAANVSTRNLSLTATATNVPIVRAGFDANRNGPFAPAVSCSGADCAAGGYTGDIGGMFLSAASAGATTGAVGTGAAIGYGFAPDVPSPAANQPFTDFIQGVAVLSTGAVASAGTAAVPVSGGTGTYRHQALGAQTVGATTYNSNYNLASGTSANAQNYLFDASGNLVRIQSSDYKLSERGTSGPPSYTDGAAVAYTGTPGGTASSPLTAALVSFSGGTAPDGNYNDSVNGIRIGRYSGATITTTDLSTPSTPLTFYTQLGSNSFIWAVRELPASIPIAGSFEYDTAYATKPTDSLGNVGTLNYASLSADFSKQTVNPAVGVTINNQNLSSAATNVPIGSNFSFDVSSNPANNTGGGSSAVQVECYGSNCAPAPVGDSRGYGGRFTGGLAGSGGTAGGAFFRYDFNTRYDPAVAAGATGGIPAGETRPVNDYIQGEVAFTKGASVLARTPATATSGNQAIATTYFVPGAGNPYYEIWGGDYQTSPTGYTSPFGTGSPNMVADYDPTEPTPQNETITGGTVATVATNATSAAATGVSFGRYTGGNVDGTNKGSTRFSLVNQGSYAWIKGPEAFPFYLQGGLTGKATYALDGGTPPAVTSRTAANGSTGILNSANLVVDFSNAAVGVDLSVTANASNFAATTGGATGSPAPTLRLDGSNGFFGSTFSPAPHESLAVTVNGSSAAYYQGQVRGQLMGPGLSGAGLTYAFQDNSGSAPGIGVNGAVAFALNSYTTNGVTTSGTAAIDPSNVPYVLGLMATGLNADPSANPAGALASVDNKYLAYVEGSFNAASRMALDSVNGLPLKWDGDVPITISASTCTPNPCTFSSGFVSQTPAQFSIDPASFGAGGATLPTGKTPATLLESGRDAATGIRWGRYGGGVVAVFDRVGGGFAPKTLDLTTQNWHGIFSPLQTGPTVLPTTGTFTYSKVGNTSPTDNLGSAAGTLNAATLVADFAAQTVNAGVNLTVNRQTWAAGANAIPIQNRLYFEAGRSQSGGGNLNICVGTTCGATTIPTASNPSTGASGRLSGGFTGTSGQGVGMAYSLNQGGVTGTTVSGVAAFKR